MATTVANKNVKTASDDNKDDDPVKKLELGLVEEDDEFEEFPVEEWTGKDAEEEDEETVNVWEDNWDDDTVEDDFSKQLKIELDKKKGN